jgi:hypothetical protein
MVGSYPTHEVTRLEQLRTKLASEDANAETHKSQTGTENSAQQKSENASDCRRS